MYYVKDKKSSILSILVRPNDWKCGLDFITDDSEFLQVGTWFYSKGKILDRHHHNIIQRQTDITQECVTVMQGSMHVEIYDNDKLLVDDYIMSKGDFSVFLRGGHSYKILEDNTRILETKNGPFLGVEKDKTRF